jgi:hypothetical protein
MYISDASSTISALTTACCLPPPLQGNLNWVASREHELTHPVWAGREEQLTPLCNAAESDSANLDHVAELMVRTGTDPQEAMMVLVPEAYRNHPDLMKEYPEVGHDTWAGWMHACMPCMGWLLWALPGDAPSELGIDWTHRMNSLLASIYG